MYFVHHYATFFKAYCDHQCKAQFKKSVDTTLAPRSLVFEPEEMHTHTVYNTHTRDYQKMLTDSMVYVGVRGDRWGRISRCRQHQNKCLRT